MRNRSLPWWIMVVPICAALCASSAMAQPRPDAEDFSEGREGSADALLRAQQACYQGKYQEARKTLSRLVELHQRKYGRDSWAVADTLEHLFDCEFKAHNWAEAEVLARRVHQIRLNVLGAASSRVPKADETKLMSLPGRRSDGADRLGNITGINTGDKMRTAQPKASRALVDRARARADLQRSVKAMADICFVQEKFDQAEPLYEQVVRSLDLKTDPYVFPTLRESDVMDSLDFLARIKIARGQHKEAEQLFNRLLTDRKFECHFLVMPALEVYAQLLRKRQRHEEANKVLQTLEQLQSQFRGLADPGTFAIPRTRAVMYEKYMASTLQ